MHFFLGAFEKAFHLIFSFDRELIGIILMSLRVSGTALLISATIGVMLSVVFAFARLPLKNLVITVLQTFMGLPPVVVGLFVYLMLSRSGPLGFMGLLYTPSAMIIAQTILAFPIVVSLCHSAIVSVDPVIRLAARTLGATPLQEAVAVIREARYGLMSGIIAAFGRVMAEVGAILIVGGNIAGYTRVMTTTIALETDKGNFELALALGMILLLISFGVNLLLYAIQKKNIRSVPR